MKLNSSAIAVASTLLASTSAFAAQIYSGEGTTLAVGGYVDVGVGKYFDENVEVHQVSPRINIEGKKEIGNGVTVDAKGEWALNYLDGGDTSFTTRLGYIGASHDKAGRAVVGTQWSPYYDVAGVADLPIAFANDFLYENHNNLGSGRAEKMVSYRNTLEISSDIALSIGLGWQGKHSDSINTTSLSGDTVVTKRSTADYDPRGQIAVSGEFAGFGVGYVYSGGDVGTKNAKSHMVSVNYGSYGKGIYVAGVLGKNDYFYDGLAETYQYEALVAFGLDNGVNISVNYESVEDDKASETQYSQSALQLEYTVTSGLMTFVGYQFDLGNDIGEKEEDYYTAGVRYFF
ncbi:putative outer membrane protein [Vibrio ichthyoenteri ATCC 700023]|uniref:Putative outer membrane protein n=1 Tax=Vibrio ichthyoenteri ATCC 700023 TaxID=870968 RepID=F9S6B5_9VIBR|nr:porin [Vibrio ichthyoenteri]EGU33741.1 putative outer membrane protein [Vibrio ichthyoenteri ATCC 700023]